jgi:1,4-alpha-glucan branching enzyme
VKQGAFTFVLHSHLPYCRMAGRWPHGEEWLHEAASETYIPLLNGLYDLVEAGLPIRLTIGLTPVLIEQLDDPLVQGHLVSYLEERQDGAEADISRLEALGEGHRAHLARYYASWYAHTLRSLEERFDSDIVGAFRQLQDDGYIEILTSAATHGYLPLLGRDSSIYGQLRVGVESYHRHFGRSPRAVWLPECAYRPAYISQEGQLRPGLESFLAELNLGLFFTETHAIEGGEPVGKAAGDAIGPYGGIKRRYVMPLPQGSAHEAWTTHQPYYVLDTTGGRDRHSGVAVMGRNNRTGLQVWSAAHGYPGDFDYREFHKKDEVSGLQYWRVTQVGGDLGDKDLYHPDWAQGKVRQHADHFIALVEELTAQYYTESGRFGIIASNYDSELFGHWWFEGVDWLQEVLRGLSQSDVVQLTTASDYLEEHPPSEVLALPESSWGVAGTHWSWDNEDTQWMWQPIHEAETRMAALVARHPHATGDGAMLLNQTARELLLLQASDWPFLITTGQAAEYATRRFNEHLARFDRLATLAEAGAMDEGAALATQLFEQDNVFPHIDYHWFEERRSAES